MAELQPKFPVLNEIKDNLRGYMNPNGGWADAAGAIALLAGICT
jgi:hypothetical protein